MAGLIIAVKAINGYMLMRILVSYIDVIKEH